MRIASQWRRLQPAGFGPCMH